MKGKKGYPTRKTGTDKNPGANKPKKGKTYSPKGSANK